jgi:hypothetical protein
MAEADYDLRKQLEPVAPLVGDEHAKVLRLTLDDRHDDAGVCKRIQRTSDPRMSAVVTETSSSTPP